jgi:dipeptidyl aminopeptidase/acylaminoacyl peptidase
MRKIIFTCWIISSVCQAQDQTPMLTVEKIMQDPKWIGSSPSNVFWSYDSKTLYFNWNPDRKSSDSPYCYAVLGDKPQKATYHDAQLAYAIHNGTYNSSRSAIVYLYKGDLFLNNLKTQTTSRITQTAEIKSDLLFSHQEQWITYVSRNTLFAWDIHSGETIQLTQLINGEAPTPKKLNEQEQWLIKQQLQTSGVIEQRKEKREAHNRYLKSLKQGDTLRKIYIGHKQVQEILISPDANFILYRLLDSLTGEKNNQVPNYLAESGFTEEITGRPKVGVPEEQSTWYIFNRQNDSLNPIKTDSVPGISDFPDYIRDYPEKYKDKKALPRNVSINSISWNEEGSACIADIFSLDNKDRWLMQLNTSTGKLSLIDHQRDSAWIAGPGIGWLANASSGWIDNNHFYFQSEASGYAHLYTYDVTTHSIKVLTHGNYEVQYSILSHDKKHFYILTNEEHPGKRQLYRIGTDGSGKQRLTSAVGDYEISLSPDEKYIAYRYSYQNKPWELFIQENAIGKMPLQITHQAMSAEWSAYPWRDTKIFSFTARDGKQVFARIYEPPPGKKNKAAVIFIHGAGYLQNVAYSWSYYFHEFMFNNLLADRGYTVMDLDYRASSGYGRDWRTGIYRYMGGKDLDDEVDGARWLVKEYGIDSNRIGCYGGSYGGFLTLMALFTQPGVFHAGAALRPVTDWAHYNHEYTSAILNEPFTDSIAYARSSPINFAAGLKGHLLICHGMVDVNVHFQDPVRLVQRLIELGKDNWELASYPVEDHGFVEPSSWTDEYKRVLKLFDTYLK